MKFTSLDSRNRLRFHPNTPGLQNNVGKNSHCVPMQATVCISLRTVRAQGHACSHASHFGGDRLHDSIRCKVLAGNCSSPFT